MDNKKKNLIVIATGLLVGTINGLLGAGGGMIVVPMLKYIGLNQKESHCNAVCVILPLSIVSSIMYILKDYVEIKNVLIYLPGGLLGAFLGTYILKKISPLWLKRVFGAFMVYAGVRLLIR